MMTLKKKEFGVWEEGRNRWNTGNLLGSETILHDTVILGTCHQNSQNS